MIRRALAGRAYRLSITVLVVAICVVAGYLAVVAVPDLTGASAGRAAASEPTPTPVPTERSAMALSPIGIEIPAGSDCGACHLTDAGAVGHQADPQAGPPAVGLPRLHRLPQARRARPDRARPLEPPQERLPGVPPGPGDHDRRRQPRPDATRAHGRGPAVHLVPRRRRARTPARGHAGSGQLLDLPQRARVPVPVRERRRVCGPLAQRPADAGLRPGTRVEPLTVRRPLRRTGLYPIGSPICARRCGHPSRCHPYISGLARRRRWKSVPG